ncbi:8882_t:CDS:2 [Funneliformis geosporum]|nr:8882_t:CDS:2 [Funneliformis geosporum]
MLQPCYSSSMKQIEIDHNKGFKDLDKLTYSNKEYIDMALKVLYLDSKN